jgi:hypothetical protein
MPMRQRIFMLVVLLLVSHPVAASDAVQVGRYLTVAPIPTAEQLEPLSVIVNVRFPRSCTPWVARCSTCCRPAAISSRTRGTRTRSWLC